LPVLAFERVDTGVLAQYLQTATLLPHVPPWVPFLLHHFKFLKTKMFITMSVGFFFC